MRPARRRSDLFRLASALVGAAVIATVPIATELRGSQGVQWTPSTNQATPPAALLPAPVEIPFPTERPDPAVVLAAKRESVAALLQKAGDGGLVPVVVGFDVPFVPEGRLTANWVEAQPVGIAAGQEAVLSQLPRSSAGAIRRYETIPFFAAQVDADALRELLVLPNVTSVDQDVHLRPLLEESTRIVQSDRLMAAAAIGGAGRSIAIVDSGVDKTHPFFANKVVSEACYSGGGNMRTVCPDGSRASVAFGSGVHCRVTLQGCEHGTMVAGIAAGGRATTDNGNPIMGVARDAAVVAIQVFSESSSAADCSPDPAPCASAAISDIIAGLDRAYALARSSMVYPPIAAVNLSLGGHTKYSSAAACWFASGYSSLKSVIDNLRSVGIPTIIGSGNDGWSDGISFPACIPTGVAVGATTKHGRVWPGSNQHPTMVQLMAPGADIWTSVPAGYPVVGGFWPESGTSLAAPHVAGAWALLQQVASLAGRTLSVPEALAALRNTGASVFDSPYAGSGVAYPEIRIYDAAVRVYSGGIPPNPPHSLTGSSTGSSLSIRWGAPSGGGDPTQYRIEAGSSPGQTNLANFGTGNTVTSYSAASVGAGTYYIRVRAENSAGTSGPSNEVPIVIAGLTPPGAPRELTASVTGTQVHFAWTASGPNGGPTSAPTGYRLIVGSSPGTNNLGTFDMGNVTSYVANNAPAGTYYARAVAYNSSGSSAASNEVRFTVGGSGGTFTVTFTNSGNGGGGIGVNGTPSRGLPFTQTFAAGTTVTVLAVPVSDSSFTGWSGAVNGTQNPASFVVAGATTVIAGFTRGSTGTLINETFDDSSTLDPSKWSFWREPSSSTWPFIDATKGNPGRSYNGGDRCGHNCGNHALYQRDIPYQQGVSIQMDFWCTGSGWHYTDAIVGLTSNRTGAPQTTLVSLHANKGSGANAIHIGVGQVGASNVARYTPNAWHTAKIVIRRDLYVEFYLDGRLVHTSANRIQDIGAPATLWLLGRSGGGPAYIDNVKVQVQ